MNVVFTNLIKDPKCQRLLPLLGEIESSVLEPPLEGEHVDVRGPVVAGDDYDVTLLMETKQQGQLVNVSNGCQGVGHRNQSWKIIVLIVPVIKITFCMYYYKIKNYQSNLGKSNVNKELCYTFNALTSEGNQCQEKGDRCKNYNYESLNIEE